MSTTLIYAVKQNEEPILIGECKNSFRGAMYVWDDISKRYFNLESFPYFDENMQRRVWNAGNENTLTNDELIVLASTMDKAVVSESGFKQLLEAFEKYGSEHDTSSILEQAELISKNTDKIPEGFCIAWNQTSVGDPWFSIWDEENEKTTCDLSKSFDATKRTNEDK